MKKHFMPVVLTMVFSLLISPTKAQADEIRDIRLGAKSQELATWTCVYFGLNSYNNSLPIRWYILDKEKSNNSKDNHMFLVSEELMYGNEAFSDVSAKGINPNSYKESYVRGSLETNPNSFRKNTNNFSRAEQAAMHETIKDDDAYDDAYGFSYKEVKEILEGDRMFLLSAYEYDIYVAATSVSYDWWLRSPVKGSREQVGYVMPNQAGGIAVAGDKKSIRPAFNIRKESILLTSTEAGGKSSGPLGRDALVKNPQMISNDIKFTLLDENRSGFTVATTATGILYESNKNIVTIEYTGATVGSREYLSALIANSKGEVLYYGRLKNISKGEEASGTQDIAIPRDLPAEKYRLMIFSEECNGNQRTDYSSPLRELSLTVGDSIARVTFKIEGGTWADGTKEDKITEVALLKGTGTLNQADVPSGMLPYNSFDKGSWDIRPNTDEGAITGDVTYRYTFTEREDTKEPVPETGESLSPELWIALCVFSAATILASILLLRGGKIK